MVAIFKRAWQEYPRQFWLMFFGMLISTMGASMIWPFLMIYASERLEIPMTTAASLMTLSSVMGLISSLVAGPIIDKVGRKWAMVISLLINATGYALLSQAHTLLEFAVIMAMNGAFNPIYRVAADAMMADMIPPEKRVDAYSLMRLSNNVGISVGPAIGGIMASASYGVTFLLGAAGMSFYSLLIALFGKETMPERSVQAKVKKEKMGGYGQILRDGAFMQFTISFTLVQVCAALIWVLLGIYAKRYYNVLENQYGLIPTTNALMVVLFQMWVTTRAKRFPPLRVLTVGALFYAVAVTSVAFGLGFWSFWLTMVIMTIGELMLVPTSSTYVANLAPADKRGRYMSLYGLSWGVASGIGPVLGGFLGDNLGPKATWFGGGVIGLLSVLAFMALSRKTTRPLPDAQQTQV